MFIDKVVGGTETLSYSYVMGTRYVSSINCASRGRKAPEGGVIYPGYVPGPMT